MGRSKNSTIGLNPLDQLHLPRGKGKKKAIVSLDPGQRSQIRKLLEKAPAEGVKGWLKSVWRRLNSPV